MKTERIATRYARALFTFALEKDIAEAIYKDMTLIEEVCANSKDLVHFLNNPVINNLKKLSVFRTLFAGKLNELSFRFLEILVRKRREMIVREIADEFIRLYKEHLNVKTVYFKTASPASKQNVQQLKDTLSRVFSSRIDLIEEVNDNLIGGFAFRIGDLQYDATIRRNINRLKKEYNVNIYVPKI